MTCLPFAFLLATLAAAPATAAADRQRPRPDPPAQDGTRANRAPMAAAAVAAAIDRRSWDIEVIVVGNLEDGVAGGSNVVELGAVSYRPLTRTAGRSAGRATYPATILKRVVTVRIGRERTGFAPLRAHLQADDGRCRIRVDGKTLTAVPQTIDPLAPLGQPVSHVVEIEISTTVSEGPVSALIAWTSDAP